MSTMQCLFTALTSRMHIWPILCQRGNEIGHFAGKRSHVDVWKAYNGDFASTRMGAAASHNQARRLRLAGPGGSMMKWTPKVGRFIRFICDESGIELDSFRLTGV